jgi:hypothetical protein
MPAPRAKFFTRLLTAAALLLATSLAAAHELEHALEQHDEPACALHLLAQHAGKTLLAVAPTVPFLAYRSIAGTHVASPTPRTGVASFRARAPPVSAV